MPTFLPSCVLGRGDQSDAAFSRDLHLRLVWVFLGRQGISRFEEEKELNLQQKRAYLGIFQDFLKYYKLLPIFAFNNFCFGEIIKDSNCDFNCFKSRGHL